MVDIGQAILRIVADRSHVDSTLSSLEGQVSGWSSRVGSVIQSAFGFAFGGFLQNAIGQAVSTVQGSIIGVNAMLETTNKQFSTLMGDAQLAAGHVKMLFDLGAETPYTTQELIGLSKHFQTFGGLALNAKENLVLFGDAAAAVQAPVERVGFWTGRLYAAIQNGKPIGDAAMNLQELGVMSGTARDKLEQMQKAGLSGSEIWKVYTEDMQRFSGAMASQATTWQGLTSTLQDNLSMLGAKAFAPLFEGAKKAVSALITLVNSDAAAAISDWIGGKLGSSITWAAEVAFPALQRGFESVVPTLQRLWGAFQTAYSIIDPIISQALSWGTNIGSQLAQGLYDSLEYVEDALGAFGDTLSYWLAPGSPPKIAPHLDEYGRAAGEEFWKGMGDADTEALQSLGTTLDTFLRDLVAKSEFAETDVIPTIIGTRQAFARVINDIDESGEVSEEAFEAMIQAAGPAGRAIAEIANRYLDLRKATKEVEEAQIELIEINDRFARQLDPLNQQLRALDDRERAIEDAERLAELNETLADESASESDKEKARIEIERMAVENQIRAVEDQAAVEIAAAEGRLSAAEARQQEAESAYQAAQRSIQAHHEENELIQKQIGLLQKLEEEATRAAKGSGGRGSGGGPKPPKPPEPPKRSVTAPEDVANPLVAVEKAVDAQVLRIQGKISGMLKAISQEIEQVIEPWKSGAERALLGIGNVIDSAATVWEQILWDHGGSLLSNLEETWNNAQETTSNLLSPISSLIGSTLDTIAGFFDRNRVSISATFGSTWDTLFDIINTAVAIIEGIVVPWLQKGVDWFDTYGEEIQLVLTGAWNAVSGIFSGVLTAMAGLLHTILAAMQGDWRGAWEGIQQVASGIGSAIYDGVDGMLNMIAGIFGTTVAELESVWSNNWNQLLLIVVGMAASIEREIRAKLQEVVGAFDDWWSDTKGEWDGFVGEADDLAVDLVMGMVDGVVRTAKQLAQAVWDAVTSALGAGQDAAEARSPSEASARLIGEPITQGIALGILRALSAAQRAAGDLVEAVMEIFEDMAAQAQELIEDSITDGFDYAVRAAQQDWDSLKILQDLVMSTEEFERRRQRILDMPESDSMKQLKDEARTLQEELEAVQQKIEDIPHATDVFSAEEAAAMEKQRAAQVADLESQAAAIEAQIASNAQAQEQEEAIRQQKIQEQLKALEDQKRLLEGTAQYLKQEFDTARAKADEMAKVDADLAAEWYDQRMKYLNQYADLWKQYSEAQTDEERAKIAEQMKENEKLRQAQEDQFNRTAEVAARENPAQDMLDSIDKALEDTDSAIDDLRDKISTEKDEDKRIAMEDQLAYLKVQRHQLQLLRDALAAIAAAPSLNQILAGYGSQQGTSDTGSNQNSLGVVEMQRPQQPSPPSKEGRNQTTTVQYILQINSSSRSEPLEANFSRLRAEERTRF